MTDYLASVFVSPADMHIYEVIVSLNHLVHKYEGQAGVILVRNKNKNISSWVRILRLCAYVLSFRGNS